MTLNARIAQALAGVGCLAVITTGCTSTVPGTASPAPTATEANSDIFAGMNACQVLDQLNAGQGYNPGEKKTRRNECNASKPGVAGNSLALDPVQGLSEFAQANAGVTDLSINGRPAMQADIPTGGCAVAVEVAEHARALVLVTLISSPRDPQACVEAQALAEKLEPLLPKVQ
ncbi:DUF3558 family protein [Amycolatopsis sp. NPDC006131]|uniref:DUF3558 family protein n=1 Tax=Amycolatopsis sp. NPDC006131 TaxID=3156731 RepID=UPI0033B3544A